MSEKDPLWKVPRAEAARSEEPDDLRENETAEREPLRFARIREGFFEGFDEPDTAREWAEDIGLTKDGAFVDTEFVVLARGLVDEYGERHAYLARPSDPKLEVLRAPLQGLAFPLRDEVLDEYRGRIFDVPEALLEDVTVQ